MKKWVWTALVCTLTLTNCTRSTDSSTVDTKTSQEVNDCIERIIIPVTAHSINSSDTATVNSLFGVNGIDNSKFRYFLYTHDTLQTFYLPYTKYDQKTVRLDQYTNGLRIFTGDLVYNFLDNSFNFRGGDLTNGTSLDTVPKRTLPELRKLFLDNIEQFDHDANRFKDSCFKAEFGYFDLNAGISYAQEELVKAWRVTLKNSFYPSEYPVAYYQDNDGRLIYYDNGNLQLTTAIRVFMRPR